MSESVVLWGSSGYVGGNPAPAWMPTLTFTGEPGTPVTVEELNAARYDALKKAIAHLAFETEKYIATVKETGHERRDDAGAMVSPEAPSGGGTNAGPQEDEGQHPH